MEERRAGGNRSSAPRQPSWDLRVFAPSDEGQVIALWQTCGLLRPWNDPLRDIARKLTVQPDMFLVAVDTAGSVVGSVMAGFDGHRGWFNYLAVAPECQRMAIGRGLVAEAERLLELCGCPKANLQVRVGNVEAIAFYEALGYAVEEVVSLGKRLIPDA